MKSFVPLVDYECHESVGKMPLGFKYFYSSIQPHDFVVVLTSKDLYYSSVASLTKLVSRFKVTVSGIRTNVLRDFELTGTSYIVFHGYVGVKINSNKKVSHKKIGHFR